MSMDVTRHTRVNTIIQNRVNAEIGGGDTEHRSHFVLNYGVDTDVTCHILLIWMSSLMSMPVSSPPITSYPTRCLLPQLRDMSLPTQCLLHPLRDMSRPWRVWRTWWRRYSVGCDSVWQCRHVMMSTASQWHVTSDHTVTCHAVTCVGWCSNTYEHQWLLCNWNRLDFWGEHLPIWLEQGIVIRRYPHVTQSHVTQSHVSDMCRHHPTLSHPTLCLLHQLRHTRMWQCLIRCDSVWSDVTFHIRVGRDVPRVEWRGLTPFPCATKQLGSSHTHATLKWVLHVALWGGYD